MTKAVTPAADDVAARKPETNPSPAAAPAAVADEGAVRSAVAAAIEAERSRAAEIRKRCDKVGLPREFADGLIERGVALERVGDAIVDELAERAAASPLPRPGDVTITADEGEKRRQGEMNWLLVKAGLGRMFEKAGEAKLDPGEFRGLTLMDIARDSLERGGHRTRGLDKRALAGKALVTRTIAQGTSDFAVLLENTMHKVLMAAYGTTPDTWSRICAIGSVSDFRPHNRYRMGMFSRLDQVLENGEFKHKAIGDAEKEIISAATFGNIVTLTRQAIINDDMSAFTRVATQLGRAARLSIEVDVYALLTSAAGVGPTMNDGKALFHADHDNIAGTAAAPTVDSFDAARVQMAQQTDPSGNEYLDLRPAIWLGPISLGGTARVINDAQYDPDTANKLQRPNKVRGLFSDVVDTPRLSGTAWYALADPASAPVLEVAFLDGQQEPFLDSEDGWTVDGVEWKVRHDYGVGAVDFRGIVKNAGA